MKNDIITRRKIFQIISIVVFFLIVFLSFNLPSENLKFGQGEIYPLNTGWEVSYGNNSYGDVTLPSNFDVKKGEELEARIKIPENFPSNFKLRIRSSMQDVKMYLENDLIFQTNKPQGGNINSPEASLWYIVDLPSNIQNKTLSMKVSSDEKAFSVSLNPIYAGNGDTLLYKTIDEKKAGVIMAALILFFGIFALIISLVVRNLLDNRIMYLGTFFILVSLWIFSETRLLQLFTGNRFIIGGISYMMLTLIPIPFVLYLRDAVFTINKKVCSGIAVFFGFNFIVNLSLQILGLYSFLTTIKFTNTMMFTLFLYIIGHLFYEVIKLKNQEAKKFLMYISLLVLFLLIEIYYFYIGYYEYTSVFTRIGILTFLIFISGSTFKQLDELILKEKEAEVMKRLAYTDILTGGFNRLAYERDLDNLTKEKIPNFRIVLMDINDLKSVNDKYGHSEGDRMIKSFYQIIRRIFEGARVYRLGGDEFTVILKDVDDYKYNQQIKNIEKDLKDLSKELNYEINVAIGSDIFINGGSQKINEFQDHIDKLMYANKRFIKQN